MNRNYELVVILDTEAKAEEQEELLKKIEKFISDAEGSFESFKDLGKKELAYPISKKKMGAFSVAKFDLSPDKLFGLRQKLQVEGQILRFLLVQKDGKVASAKPKAAKRS